MKDLLLGGRYRLLERLAVTVMSEVWRAHDLELDRRVAVKLLGHDADPERFSREAQAAAALSHPNIGRLYDYGATEGRRYIVLELLPGGSLEDRLSPGRPLSDADAARITRAVASALGYAHAQGVVHRDVKPSNVLFDEEGRAKLTDFGIARLVDASTLTEAGTVLGTAAYLSPEQARGEAVGPAADVYALGVILYRMLTGQLPFEAENAIQLAAMHAAEEPTPIASLRTDAPPDLERIAMRALAKSPSDRPPDGSAVVAELTDVDDQTHVLAAAKPRQRWVRARHIAAGAGLAAIALTGAAVAVLATPEPSGAPVTGAKPTTTPRPHTDRTRDTARARAATAPTASASTSSTTSRTKRSTLPATTARNTSTLPSTTPATTEPAPTTESTTTTEATTSQAATTDATTTTVSTTTP